MIIELLLINLILTLIFYSGFVDEVDGMISRKWRFHHLPKPFSCLLCSTFWASLIWVAVTHQFSLISLALCLANAALTDITLPLVTLIREWALKIISWIMPR